MSPIVQPQPDSVREKTRSELFSDRSIGREKVSFTPEASPNSLVSEQSDQIASEAALQSIVEQHEIQIADTSFPRLTRNNPKRQLDLLLSARAY